MVSLPIQQTYARQMVKVLLKLKNHYEYTSLLKSMLFRFVSVCSIVWYKFNEPI